MLRPRPPKARNESAQQHVFVQKSPNFPHPELLSPNAKLGHPSELKRQIFRTARRTDSQKLVKPVLGGLVGLKPSNNSSNSEICQSAYRESSNSPKPNLSRLLQIGGQPYLASLPLENIDHQAKAADSNWAGFASRRPQDTLQRITAGINTRKAHSIKPVREESQDLRQTKPNSSKNFLATPGDLPDPGKPGTNIVSPRDYQGAAGLEALRSRRIWQQRSELQASGKSILREESLQFDRSRQTSPRSANPLHNLTGRCFEQINKAKQLQKEGQKFRDLMRVRGNELVSSIFSKKVSMTSVNEGSQNKSKPPKPVIHVNWEQDNGLDNRDFEVKSAVSYQFSNTNSRRDDFMSKSYDDRSDRNILKGFERLNFPNDLKNAAFKSTNRPKLFQEPHSNEATKLDLRHHRKSEIKTNSSRTSVQILDTSIEKCDSARSKYKGYEVQFPDSQSKRRLQNLDFPHSRDKKLQQAGQAFLVVPVAAFPEHETGLPRNLQVVIPPLRDDSDLVRTKAVPSAKAQELAEIRAKYRFLE